MFGTVALVLLLALPAVIAAEGEKTSLGEFIPADPPQPAPEVGFTDVAGNPASLADFLADGPAPSWLVRVGTCLALHFPGNHRLCLDRPGLLVRELGRRLFAILTGPAAKETHSAAKETHSGSIGRWLADFSHPEGRSAGMSKCFRAYQRRSDEWPGCEYRDDRQAKRAARAAGPEGGYG